MILQRKNKGPSFQSREPAATDSSSCVCDLTADSDPDVPNDSKMLLDPNGDSDSARHPLKYKHGNADTRELEAGVYMSWEMVEARLREWDMNSRFGPCMSQNDGNAPQLDLDPPVFVQLVQHHGDVPRNQW